MDVVLGSKNVEGVTEAQEELQIYMEKLGIDVLAIQETHKHEYVYKPWMSGRSVWKPGLRGDGWSWFYRIAADLEECDWFQNDG